jgi:hypothetical protein
VLLTAPAATRRGSPAPGVCQRRAESPKRQKARHRRTGERALLIFGVTSEAMKNYASPNGAGLDSVSANFEKQFVTLEDAGKYITKLPKAEQEAQECGRIVLTCAILGQMIQHVPDAALHASE